VLPRVVTEGEHLLEMRIVPCVPLLASLLQCALRVGVAGCRVDESAQLPDQTAAAVSKPLIVSCEGGQRLLLFRSHLRWFLQE
jgi:hypothetical protein